MHALARKHGYTPHIRARGEEIKLKARTHRLARPTLDRRGTHSWLNRNRGILIRWCKKDQNHLALLQLACGLIAFKKARLAILAAAQPG
jgi:putative transposase